MTVGYPLTKAALDARIGYLVTTLEQVFEGTDRLFELLSRPEFSIANLQTELGYEQDEAQTLYDVVFALHLLGTVAHGQSPVPNASNFLYNAWKVRGVE